MLLLSCAQHIAYAMGSPIKKSVVALAAFAANPVEAFVLPATQGVAGVQISAPFCTAPHRVAQPVMYPPWIQKDNLGRTVYDMKDPVGLFHKERVEAFTNMPRGGIGLQICRGSPSPWLYCFAAWPR